MNHLTSDGIPTCPLCGMETYELYVMDDVPIGCPACVEKVDAYEYYDRKVDHHDEYRKEDEHDFR